MSLDRRSGAVRLLALACATMAACAAAVAAHAPAPKKTDVVNTESYWRTYVTVAQPVSGTSAAPVLAPPHRRSGCCVKSAPPPAGWT